MFSDVNYKLDTYKLKELTENEATASVQHSHEEINTRDVRSGKGPGLSGCQLISDHVNYSRFVNNVK